MRSNSWRTWALSACTPGRDFDEVKYGPLYVVQKTLNIDHSELAPADAMRMYSDGFADP